ncbi:DUF5723 family protein [Reichenbachiella carrageenanivorans]|uniref:DUF5723 family protein n=1 Tax=Reichenbachiella carrageenanivorans TaxID=2979869 RepID=A0ABY6D455_9BACT|nr:DUF5723 family protein [Reichenbachiella carrageenanivorans]UXX80694.1 DUF5723 family protein [Reichenbachiella carrageenanivorans]
MNYKLKTTYICVLLLVLTGFTPTLAQSGISLYHLTNSTYQGNNFNPAFFPEGKTFVGIPVLSGVMVDFNSPTNYNDAITTNENGERKWDIDRFVDNSKKRNYVSAEAEISTFYVGWKKSATQGFSVFIRERIGARGFYSDDLVNTAWKGNTPLIGDRLDLKGTALDVRYYREYGFGIWKSLPGKGVNIGVRVKFLNGMMSAVTDSKFDGSIGFEEDNYQANFNLKNSAIYTSGFNIMDSNDLTTHMISNGNLGAGIDLGVHWKITKELSAAVSVNDLGFIRWKVDTENYHLADTTFRFEGIDLADVGDFGDAYIDSLKYRIQDTTLYEAYTTGLNTSSYASLMYQLTPYDRFTGTIAAHVVQGHFRMIYSAAYTRKVGRALDFSVNVSRIPQQGIDVGLAAAVNLGPCQIYMASDKLLKVWDATQIDAADFRFGMNLVFGKKSSSPRDNQKDLEHPSPYDKSERIEKSDGIYWIIPRQKARPVYDKTKFKDS